jgi:voltage-gated potassium channel
MVVAQTQSGLERQRWRLLSNVTRFTDKIMTALAFVWLALMIWEFTHELNGPLAVLTYGIWGLFALDFLLKLAIAPKKVAYLRKNWLTAVALVLPAFRTLRVLRAARALRALRLARIITSLNRGMGAIGKAMKRHGVGYVIALTILVTFAGAAGMYQFERVDELRGQGYAAAVAGGAGFASYSDALWWTTMIMTTLGSQYWPVTSEGRLLCLLLALYGLSVFGYITATIASLFVRQDRIETGVVPVDAKRLAAIENELKALRAQLSLMVGRER